MCASSPRNRTTARFCTECPYAIVFHISVEATKSVTLTLRLKQPKLRAEPSPRSLPILMGSRSRSAMVCIHLQHSPSHGSHPHGIRILMACVPRWNAHHHKIPWAIDRGEIMSHDKCLLMMHHGAPWEAPYVLGTGLRFRASTDSEKQNSLTIPGFCSAIWVISPWHQPAGCRAPADCAAATRNRTNSPREAACWSGRQDGVFPENLRLFYNSLTFSWFFQCHRISWHFQVLRVFQVSRHPACDV